MDINQAARMIEWLDEERRRDKAMIATLEERLAQQQDTISTLTKRLGSIESDQSTMRSQFVPSGREGDLLDQVRKEIQLMIDAVDTKRLTAERETERRSELAREGTARSVRELTEKIGKLERQSTEMPAIAVERDRLAASVAALQQRVDDVFKKLEDPDRRLAFLEEQRRQDARRISEAQSEVPELQKQIDSIKPKLSLIEDLALRTERRMQDIQNGERERREQIQAFIDQQTLLLQQRDQQINELVAKFGEQDSVMTRNIERFETWAEAYRGMKKIIDDFERIGDRLERRINEVAEMQRLSEERFRQEWNDWTGEDQKRWKQFTLSNDEVWRSHDKEFERFVLRITEMQQLFAPIQESVDRLWRMERERAKLYRETYQALLLNFDTGGSLSSASAPVGNGAANGINTGSGG